MNSAYLLSLFAEPADPSLLVYGRYSAPMVLLAVLVAVFASWMALQMAGQARRAPTQLLRVTAISTGALALGAGVWAMHFVGMLAFDLCTNVEYDVALTLWSLLPSFGASFVALTLMARSRIGKWQLLVGAVLMGAGIGTMHYMGMGAMRVGLSLHYEPLRFALSIVVAIVLAGIALWIRFGLAASRLKGWQRLLVSSVVMGSAITGMHFMGMAAARFVGMTSPEQAVNPANGGMIALEVSMITAALAAAVAALNGWLRYREMFSRLHAQEARERALLAAADDGVVTLDADGMVTDCNPAAERLFGYTSAQVRGRAAGALLKEVGDGGPADAASPPAAERQHHGGVTGRTAVMRAQCADGRELAVRAVFSPRQQMGGDLCVVYLRDISAHKAMQQALEESERQLRSLVDSLPGVAFRMEVAPGWPVLYVSEAMERALGYPASDFIGPQPKRSLFELILEEDRALVMAEMHAATQDRESHLAECRIRAADGRVRWMWSNGRATYDAAGRAQWIDGVMLDSTERKEAELAIQRFHSLVEDSGDAIFSTDAYGVLLSWNKGAERIWGYTAAEAIGRRSVDLIAEPGSPNEPIELRKKVMAGGRVVQHQGKRRRKDGTLIDISATISPVRAPDGRISGIAMIARDITEQLRLQAELRAAKEEAERAAASRTAFLANMSHEIRTPMNAVLGFTDVLLESELQPQQRRHLDIIRESGRSLLHLLNEVLDLAKLDRGAMEVEEGDFNLLALIDGLTSTMGHQARAKGLAVEVDYAADLPEAVHGDELRLRQVLINLLGNAIKFTAQGSVSIRVRRAALGAGQPGLHFTVRDSGIGIAPERLAAIFDPFTQADASMSRRYGGTGLGTTIAKQLSELMGGRIWAESTPGVGSAFHVMLPLKAALAPPVAKSALQLPQLPPLRILAVDDVPQNLELLAAMLEAHGHRVLHAGGGAQAVERVAHEAFDAVLMDVHMPGMDGLTATRMIRAAEAQRGGTRVPVIALTASVQETDLLAARAAGMDGFATKPMELSALLAELGRVTGAAVAAAEDSATPTSAATPPAPPAGRLPPKALLPAWVGASEMAARLPGIADEATAARARVAALPALDYAGGLKRCGGKQAFYLRMLDGFTTQYAQVAQSIIDQVRAGDLEDARAAAHKLRGVTANLGLQALWKLAEALELALEAGDGAQVEVLLELLPGATREALEAVANAGAAARSEAMAAVNAAGSTANPAGSIKQDSASTAAPLPAAPAATPASVPAPPALEALGARLLHAFARGQLDEAALAALLAHPEASPADLGALKQAVDHFDLTLARTRLSALLAASGKRRAESTT